MSDIWTIKKLLDWTADHFKKHQIDDPRLEAEILLANALGKERIKLYIDFEKEVGKQELQIFKSHIQRRIKREPTAYITGCQPFMSLNIKVTPDVLIPRPETELLVQEAIDIAKKMDKRVLALDIGTGSGAIAVTLAKFVDQIDVYATDLSRKALDIAKENAIAHKVDKKVRLIEADIFPNEDIKFDIIVSNPPYIRTDDIKGLQPEIRDHEPVKALDGGADGMDHYRKIIGNAGPHLVANGYLILEIGEGQSENVIDIIKNRLKAKEIIAKKDLSGIERIVIAEIQ